MGGERSLNLERVIDDDDEQEKKTSNFFHVFSQKSRKNIYEGGKRAFPRVCFLVCGRTF